MNGLAVYVRDGLFSSLCIIFDVISSDINGFYKSSNLLSYLSLETLSPIIRTG